MTEPQRKSMFGFAKLNIHGQGIILKKIPITLLQRLADFDDAAPNNSPAPGADDVSNNAKIKRAVRQMHDLKIMEEVRKWGRGGLDNGYLNELTQGLPWIRHGNCIVAFKASGQGANATFEPVGFVVYGTFNPFRHAEVEGSDSSQSNSSSNQSSGPGKKHWYIDINNVDLDDAKAGKIAEIEGVITADNETASGVGKAIFEYALGDLLSRKKTGASRYTHVITFTSYTKMKNLATSYGFQNKVYRLRDIINDNDITTRLVNKHQVAESPNHLRAYIFNVNEKIQTAINKAKDRVVKSNICPASKDPLYKFWMLCK